MTKIKLLPIIMVEEFGEKMDLVHFLVELLLVRIIENDKIDAFFMSG